MSGQSETARVVGPGGAPNPETATVRVFLVHSREIVRGGLRHLLETTPGLDLVGEAEAVTGSVRRVARSRPDVVIIDVSLPDDGAIDLARTIRAKNRRARCVIFGRSDREEARRAAEAANAHGYLTDDVRARVLLDVIRRVARGQRMMTRASVLPLDAAAVPMVVRVQDPKLTTREQQVLKLIGTGMTNRQIGNRLGLAEKTVKNYVSALMAKLQVERRTQAAIYEMTHNGHAAYSEGSAGSGDVAGRVAGDPARK